ncbi:MAG: hypothetical protein JRJ12_09155 [Deltaproteobacteria bacterium]|nr:hypothetical protein [Deltaproteobacteria bacterium]MBW2070406.1 hypothetical protein [Deltaproteobacteria bacterium]
MKRLLIILSLFLYSIPTLTLADDTIMYTSMPAPPNPNVLIIFDNSTSMSTVDVPSASYDPSVLYPNAGYNTNAVYQRISWDTWQLVASSTNDISCPEIKDQLINAGEAWGSLMDAAANFACSSNNSDTKFLRTGNYLNFAAYEAGPFQSRLDAAKQAFADLINNTPEVNFGLMAFNYSQGGYLVGGCGTDKSTLIANMNALTASTWTPLAETAAEAGLYFAGMASWFNSGTTYTSPIQHRCQQNHIIILADSESTYDLDTKLTTGAYINGDTIGDYDADGNDPGSYPDYGSDYLDDVAKYLHENDCNSSLGTVGDFEKQTITVHTIGFRHDSQLLKDAAANGGGDYFSATNSATLNMALRHLLSEIKAANELSFARGNNAVFLAPAVPAAHGVGAFAGNRVYLGFFKTAAGGNWLGNIKKYTISSAGQVLDQNNQSLLDADGQIMYGTQSFWSSSYDGPEVAMGGAGEVLKSLGAANRTLITYIENPPAPALPNTNLTAPQNALSSTNPMITSELLGYPTAGVQAVLDEVYGVGKEWLLGDFIHSQPAIVDYWNDLNGDGLAQPAEVNSYIFAGGNDGMLHCFDDANGSEAWGFVPPNQLSRLQMLLDANHDYFVDASPVVYQDAGQKIIIFGERRGGNHYYALDITDPLTPTWLYKIGPSYLEALDGNNDGSADGPAARLGQSWSKPEIHDIKTGNAGNPVDTVFLLAGGYDPGEDAEPPPSSDSVGKAVFAVRVTDGQVSIININGGNWTDAGGTPVMTHAIVDLTGVDSNGDGFMNRIYAADLGGHLFAFRDDDYDGNWEKRKLFELPDSLVVGAQTFTLGKKFFHAPDATEEVFGEYIFIGTGDRAHPMDTSYTNGFYVIKNYWEPIGTFSTITLSQLLDVTQDLIQVGTAAQKESIRATLSDPNNKGWYIRLEHLGEKMVSTPVVYDGGVYFTTYTPPDPTLFPPSDPCAEPNKGTARLYALDYRTGAAVINFDESNSDLTKEDRSVVIGESMPSSATIAVLQDTPTVLVGLQGGSKTLPASVTNDVHIYYWRQLFSP